MTKIETTETKPTNTFALVGFILSIAGFVTGITAIAGIILGHIGLHQIKKTGEAGHGLGVAALIMGYIQVGLWVLALIGFVLFMVFVGWSYINHGGGMNYNDHMMVN
jgi:uncharacterized membrane protein